MDEKWVPHIQGAWETYVSDVFYRINRNVRWIVGIILLAALFLMPAFSSSSETVQVHIQDKTVILTNDPSTSMRDKLVSLFGLLTFFFGLWATSMNRSKIRWNTVLLGLFFQMVIALFVIKTSWGRDLFAFISTSVAEFLAFSEPAFGFFIANENVGKPWFILIVFPAIIFFVGTVQLLYHTGTVQWIITKFAIFFSWSLHISGAEAVVAAASPFVGQGENAVIVKPFIDGMTKSEMHQIMTSGFATIAGSVLQGYVLMGVPLTNVITASVMSIPGAIIISKMRVPETEEPLTMGKVEVVHDDEAVSNWIQAFSNGCNFGLKICGLIFSSILGILAFVYMSNHFLNWFGGYFGISNLNLELIFTYIFYPFAWLTGAPQQDVIKIAKLLGTRMITNEFVAYSLLRDSAAGYTARGFTIATYSLCGFANIASMGTCLGIMSAMAPKKTDQVSQLLFSSLLCGTLSTIVVATITALIL